MHYGNGAVTRCRDVLESEFEHCSDLNTTRFLRRLIEVEKPDFVAFTGILVMYYAIIVLFYFILEEASFVGLAPYDNISCNHLRNKIRSRRQFHVC